jgi:predicted  nucleic acid-binding Zn-ribbon protein
MDKELRAIDLDGTDKTPAYQVSARCRNCLVTCQADVPRGIVAPFDVDLEMAECPTCGCKTLRRLEQQKPSPYKPLGVQVLPSGTPDRSQWLAGQEDAVRRAVRDARAREQMAAEHERSFYERLTQQIDNIQRQTEARSADLDSPAARAGNQSNHSRDAGHAPPANDPAPQAGNSGDTIGAPPSDTYGPPNRNGDRFQIIPEGRLVRLGTGISPEIQAMWAAAAAGETNLSVADRVTVRDPVEGLRRAVSAGLISRTEALRVVGLDQGLPTPQAGQDANKS